MNELRNTKKNLPLLILMASITLMAILCELMPSGVLPQMGKMYGISDSKAGILVGIYAVSSAVFGIYLVSATISWSRKKLLFLLLTGFSISNIIVSLAPSFETAIVGRLLGGICAGTLWPMITAYGMQLVDIDDQGKAVTIIMSGITVGMSVGIPFMTWVGNYFGYRVSFFILGISLFIIGVFCHMKLPEMSGEKLSKRNSPFTMLKNSGIIVVIVLTFLGVGSNYGLYTFITNLVSNRSYPDIEIAQMFFGIGSVISVFLTMKFIDKYLSILMISVYLLGAGTMALFYLCHEIVCIHLAFVLWGITFGSLSSVYQTATARQVKEGVAVANSIQSTSFNFAIMAGSSGAGYLLDNHGIMSIVIAAFGVFAIGLVISLLSQKKFKSV